MKKLVVSSVILLGGVSTLATTTFAAGNEAIVNTDNTSKVTGNVAGGSLTAKIGDVAFGDTKLAVNDKNQVTIEDTDALSSIKGQVVDLRGETGQWSLVVSSYEMKNAADETIPSAQINFKKGTDLKEFSLTNDEEKVLPFNSKDFEISELQLRFKENPKELKKGALNGVIHWTLQATPEKEETFR